MGNRIYVDESAVDRFIQRERGRAPRGVKIEDCKRGRKFQRMNVVAGLRDGQTLGVFCYEGTTDSLLFEWWFKEILLKQAPKGCTVILDNASFHRKSALKKLAEEAGLELLFLPPYSPDLNPIEKTWANMKRALRDLLPQFDAAYKAVFVALGFLHLLC
jgi:hypothetical protein